MNKFVKFSIIGLLIIVVICVFVYLKLFVFGSKDYSSVVIDKVSVGSNEIFIKGTFSDSGRAFKDYSYTIVGDEIYVTIVSVLVSNSYKDGNFEINIPANGSNIRAIHLTDDKTTKVIYNKEID